MDKITKQFLGKGPFTFEDVYEAFKGENERKTLHNYLYTGLKEGGVKPIKRGLYYVEALSDEESQTVPDPFLVAAKLAKNSVLTYHSALELHGAAYSHSHRVYFYSTPQTRRFEFMDVEYVPIQKKVTWGVTTLEREGNTIRLTDRERTVLDCLDRPDYTGGLEELFKSLDLFPSADLEKLKTYLRKAGKLILYAKAGFLLEHFKDRWNVSETFLNELAKKVEGKENRYFCAKKGNGKLINRWNLIVPENFNSLLQAA